MSDGFDPLQPQGFSHPGNMAIANQRPVIATVFGILNLVFGILGVCGNLAGMGVFAVVSSDLVDENMKAQMNMQQFEDPVVFRVLCTQMVFGGILSVVAIVGGVGLLNFKPWGRKLSNIYAVAYLILLVLGTTLSMILTVVPAINEANAPGANPEKIGAAAGGVAGGVFGLCFGIIYPICILIFLNRRQFVEQIKGR